MRRIIAVCAAVLLIASIPAGASGEGVDPLRGRWEVAITLEDAESPTDVRVFLNDLVGDPDDPGVFITGGCVLSLNTGLSAPLAAQAIDNADGTWDVTMIGTVTPDPEGPPTVIALTGAVDVFGAGVSDDVAAGVFESDYGPGTWTGVHHDRRQPKCDPVEPGDQLFFGADLYAAGDGAEGAPPPTAILEGFTNIVSSGMLVSSVDGNFFAPPFTDLFTPGVDFVSEFRYLAAPDGLTPTIGAPYTFTLLDIFGDPIPGAVFTDSWFGCTHGAPGNVTAIYVFEDRIDVEWDPVAPAAGFDPANGVGFYQLEVGGFFGAVTENGTTEHVIPWPALSPDGTGSPDGFDFGVALIDFPDNDVDNPSYGIDVIAFAESTDANPDSGLACQLRDSSASPTFSKAGSSITVTNP